MLKSNFHHRPLTSTLKKRRQHRRIQQTTSKTSLTKIFQVIGIVGITIGIAICIWKSPWFHVQSISCSTQFTPSCDEAVLGELNQGLGRHLLFGSWNQEIANIQQANPSYAEFQKIRKFPSKIEFQVTLSPPRYILAYENQKLVVTEKGAVIYNLETEGLPLFAIPLELWAQFDGQKLLPDDQHHSFLQLAVCFSQQQIHPHHIDWKSAQEIQLDLPGGKTALIIEQNCSRQLKELQTVLDYPFEEDWSVVDLRFNKPILKK